MEISRPRIESNPLSDTRSRFIIEPLEPGFGYTLGNSLRRTLLSSIPGAAVTSIKIDGVLHEFSSIQGVKEDVTDVILNVKELRLRSETNEPATMFLRSTGPGDVTAADIVPPADIDVINPELHLATLNTKAKLEMELRVEKGRGYRPAERNKSASDEIGRIPVDSIFSPVRRVSYTVEATRSGEMTNYDRLILDVEIGIPDELGVLVGQPFGHLERTGPDGRLLHHVRVGHVVDPNGVPVIDQIGDERNR